jgi:hypothetical protein
MQNLILINIQSPDTRLDGNPDNELGTFTHFYWKLLFLHYAGL